MFLVKLQTFNNIAVTESVAETVFSKLQALYCKWQRRSLLQKSVLGKLQIFTINGNDCVCDGFCDGICFNLRL